MNYGFGFTRLAARLHGRYKHRPPRAGRYNPARRGEADAAGHKARPLRLWSPGEWQAYCRVVPRGMR